LNGKFIVFEGGEGAGKTTQVAMFRDWLELHLQQRWGAAQRPPQIHCTREPGGTRLGQSIRQLLLTPIELEASPDQQAPDQQALDPSAMLSNTMQEAMQDRTELLLYAADRAQHVEAMLKPTLQRGDWVICDRYTDSTLAYQGYGRGLDRGLVEQLNAIATGGLVPDCTLWLDIDPEAGLARTHQRGQADRLELADLGFHQRVRQGFAALAAAHPERILRIDARPPETQVAEEIQQQFTPLLEQWCDLAKR
jgi:dTMP kinase